FGTWRHGDRRLHEADAIGVAADRGGIEAVVLVLRRDHRAKEVVLQHRTPAAARGLRERGLAQVLSIQLAVLLAIEERRTGVRVAGRLEERTLDTLQALGELQVGIAAPGCFAAVADDEIEADLVAAAMEGVALLDFHAVVGLPRETDHQLILAGGKVMAFGAASE